MFYIFLPVADPVGTGFNVCFCKGANPPGVGTCKNPPLFFSAAILFNITEFNLNLKLFKAFNYFEVSAAEMILSYSIKALVMLSITSLYCSISLSTSPDH